MKFRMNAYVLSTCLFVAASSQQLAAAQTLKLDNSKSAVQITFKQMEVPVQANFKRFSANIELNEKQIEQSKAQVEIDMNSFELPAPEYNKEVQKKEWFNSAQFPKANFVATSMKSLGTGKLQVEGKLTIKGKTSAISFPMTYTNSGAQQSFEGSLPIKRLTFNIGEGEWKDTSMVADDVVIKFKVVTSK